MSAYAPVIHALQKAIIEHAPQKALPLLENADKQLEQRLGVYIEGYRIRLVQAVLSDYPALVHYMGEPQARELARAYVDTTPSIYYSLDDYTPGFADFMHHAQGDGFAVALTAVEAAIAKVFWLPDSTAFAPPDTLTPEMLAELRLTPRAASHLLVLDYPIEAYLAQTRAGLSPAAIDAGVEYMLIVRQHNEVKRHVLSQAEYHMLAVLRAGEQVGVALESVTLQYPELLPEVAANIQHWFTRWVSEGFFQQN